MIEQCVQRENYPVEFACLSAGNDLPKISGLRTLNPFIDQDGLLRVGGRLKHVPIEKREKHPIIIPGKSHIALLITRHFHERVRQQQTNKYKLSSGELYLLHTQLYRV